MAGIPVDNMVHSMRRDWISILGVAGGSLVWLFLSWSYLRGRNGGRPLTPTQRSMVYYGYWFVLGMCYSIVFAYPNPLWIIFTIIWGVLLGISAYRQHHRKNTFLEKLATTQPPIRAKLKIGISSLALYICLIGGAIQWELVIRGRGRVMFGLIWTAGVITAIVLARSSRRTNLFAALRGILLVLIIGALAHGSLPGLVFVAITAGILFGLQKLWKKDYQKLT